MMMNMMMIETQCYDWTISRKNWLTFGGDRDRIRITDHFSTFLAIAEWEILGDLLAFLIQSPADVHDTRGNDTRRQSNKFTTFCDRSGRHPGPNPVGLIR